MNEVAAGKIRRWLIFAIVIFTVGGFLFWYFYEKSRPPSLDSLDQSVTQSISDYQSLPFDQLPPGLPADIPLLAVERVIINTVYNSSGLAHSIRKYLSSIGSEQLYNSYVEYLENGNWSARTTSDGPTVKVISASKNVGRLFIIISQNDQAHGSVVNITFLRPLTSD